MTPFNPPQVDYRADPSHGQTSQGLDHPDRGDPNRGGTVFGPQADGSFHAYDVVGDATAFNHLSPSTAMEVIP